MSIYVDANAEACFFENIHSLPNKQQDFGVLWQVTAGGYKDIDVRVFDPHQKVVYSVDRQGEGDIRVPVRDSGRYKVCFGNRMSTVSRKEVTVALHILDDRTAVPRKLNDHAAKERDILPLNDLLTRLEQQIVQLKEHEHFLRESSLAQHVIAENSSKRVLLSIVSELFVLLIVNGWQINTLRSFFEVKKRF